MPVPRSAVNIPISIVKSVPKPVSRAQKNAGPWPMRLLRNCSKTGQSICMPKNKIAVGRQNRRLAAFELKSKAVKNQLFRSWHMKPRMFLHVLPIVMAMLMLAGSKKVEAAEDGQPETRVAQTGFVYSADERSNSISVIDLSTGQLKR